MDAKHQILNAAATLFAQKGFAATSIREIAALASVNLAMIHYYFKSKDQLLENMMRTSVSSIIKRTEQLMEEDISEIEKIDRIIDAHSEHLFSNKELAVIFFQEQMISSNSTIRKVVQQLSDWDKQVFRQIIMQGKKKRRFSPLADASLLYATLMGTFQQVVVEMTTTRQRQPDDHLMSENYNKEEIVVYLKGVARKLLQDE